MQFFRKKFNINWLRRGNREEAQRLLPSFSFLEKLKAKSSSINWKKSIATFFGLIPAITPFLTFFASSLQTPTCGLVKLFPLGASEKLQDSACGDFVLGDFFSKDNSPYLLGSIAVCAAAVYIGALLCLSPFNFFNVRGSLLRAMNASEGQSDVSRLRQWSWNVAKFLLLDLSGAIILGLGIAYFMELTMIDFGDNEAAKKALMSLVTVMTGYALWGCLKLFGGAELQMFYQDCFDLFSRTFSQSDEAKYRRALSAAYLQSHRKSFDDLHEIQAQEFSELREALCQNMPHPFKRALGHLSFAGLCYLASIAAKYFMNNTRQSLHTLLNITIKSKSSGLIGTATYLVMALVWASLIHAKRIAPLFTGNFQWWFKKSVLFDLLLGIGFALAETSGIIHQMRDEHSGFTGYHLLQLVLQVALGVAMASEFSTARVMSGKATPSRYDALKSRMLFKIPGEKPKDDIEAQRQELGVMADELLQEKESVPSRLPEGDVNNQKLAAPKNENRKKLDDKAPLLEEAAGCNPCGLSFFSRCCHRIFPAASTVCRSSQ